MKWFKHDSNASIDAKIERLILKYGIEGYGLYFYCLEMIARTVEKHNLSFELEHDAELIANRIGMHREKVQEMMTFMVNLELFENDRGIVTCLKMASRTDEYTQKLLKLQPVTNVPTNSRQTPDSVETKSVLIEENRIEEKIPKNRFIPPTVQEVKDYILEKSYEVDAERFVNFYESKGWVVGKAKMKSWKAAIANWNSRPIVPVESYGRGGI